MSKKLYYITTNGYDLLVTDDELRNDDSVRIWAVAPNVSAEVIHEWREKERWFGDPMPDSLREYLESIECDDFFEYTNQTVAEIAGLNRDGQRDCNDSYMCGAIEVDF